MHLVNLGSGLGSQRERWSKHCTWVWPWCARTWLWMWWKLWLTNVYGSQSVLVVAEWDDRRVANVPGESQVCRDWGGVRHDQDFREENSLTEELGSRCWGDGVNTFRCSEAWITSWVVSTIKSSELEERQRLRVEEGGVIKFGIMSSCSMMATIWRCSRQLWSSFTGTGVKQHCNERPRQWNCHMFTIRKFHDTNVKKSKCSACHKAREWLETWMSWKRERRGRSMSNRWDQVKARRDGRADSSWRSSWKKKWTFQHQHGDGSQESGDDANQDAREPHNTRSKRSTESKIEKTPQQYDCECSSVLAWLRGRVKINWVFQPCKSRQVTSQFGVIYLRRTMSTQHWSRLVMLQVNTSSEQSV